MLRIATDANKNRFLDAIATLGTVKLASDSTGISIGTHYRWIKTDAAYRDLYADAAREASELLIAAVIDRSLNGVEETVIEYEVRDGEPVEVKRRKSKRMSDTVLLKALAAYRPELFGDKIKQEITEKHEIQDIDLSRLTSDELNTIEALLKKASNEPDPGTC